MRWRFSPAWGDVPSGSRPAWRWRRAPAESFGHAIAFAIASDFACILTVTHMPHLKEAFQARIEVSKTQQVALRALCARKLEAIAKVPVPLGQSRDSYFGSATPKCKSTHVERRKLFDPPFTYTQTSLWVQYSQRLFDRQADRCKNWRWSATTFRLWQRNHNSGCCSLDLIWQMLQGQDC
ncbi:exonuclease SbcC [Scytonema sp. HK-05]|nr:exonuclease SbcC [Scytonema sp. HK-05]